MYGGGLRILVRSRHVTPLRCHLMKSSLSSTERLNFCGTWCRSDADAVARLAYANSPNWPSSKPRSRSDLLLRLTSSAVGGGGSAKPPAAASPVCAEDDDDGGGASAKDWRDADSACCCSCCCGRLRPNLEPRLTVMVSPSLRL